MNAFLSAAVLLSLERVCYVWIYRRPDQFRAAVNRLAGDPVTAVRILFVGFKAVQVAVFAGWCVEFSGGAWWPGSRPAAVVVAATLLVIAGQALNVSVFHRLGSVGVFYGARLGREVSWTRAFPFSWIDHPQYVGTVLTIWGVFLFMRFPHADWIVLPALETVYYALGARFER